MVIIWTYKYSYKYRTVPAVLYRTGKKRYSRLYQSNTDLYWSNTDMYRSVPPNIGWYQYFRSNTASIRKFE